MTAAAISCGEEGGENRARRPDEHVDERQDAAGDGERRQHDARDAVAAEERKRRETEQRRQHEGADTPGVADVVPAQDPDEPHEPEERRLGEPEERGDHDDERQLPTRSLHVSSYLSARWRPILRTIPATARRTATMLPCFACRLERGSSRAKTTPGGLMLAADYPFLDLHVDDGRVLPVDSVVLAAVHGLRGHLPSARHLRLERSRRGSSSRSSCRSSASSSTSSRRTSG